MFGKGKLTILLVFVALVLTAFSGVVVADEHENGEEENVTDVEPIEFDEQELDDEGAVEVALSNETLEDAEYVLLTYMQDEDEVAGDADEVVAGLYELGENDTEVSVEVEDDGGYPGEHTAYAVSGLSIGGYDAGDVGISDSTSDNVVAYDYAEVLEEVDDEADDEDEEEEEVPRVVFEDQTSEGDSVVVAESACMSQDYVIVIHEDDDGEPGDAIGHEDVEEGVNEDTTVDLDEALDEGDHTLYAMLHEEAEDDDYGPSLERDGETVVDDAVVTVEDEEEEEDDEEADDEEVDDEEVDDEEVDDEEVDDEDDDTEPEDEGLPGFTAVAALIALIAAAFLAKRE